MPDTPVCLYGIMSDEDSLPHFFRSIYPYMMEPRDAEAYVEICDKIKAWQLVHVNNCQFMDQLIENLQEDITKEPVMPEVLKDGLDSIKAIFE